MEFKELHKPFKDDDSPSIEGQIKWLQKQGFQQYQIEQAMIEAYTELQMEKTPLRWSRKMKKDDGAEIEEVKYGPVGKIPKGANWESRPIESGFELDQFLLEMAKLIRTNELSVMVRHMEKFEKDLRKKWSNQVPWWKRALGIKPE